MKRLVLVEYEALMREELGEMLRKAGYQVDEVSVFEIVE